MDDNSVPISIGALQHKAQLTIWAGYVTCTYSGQFVNFLSGSAILSTTLAFLGLFTHEGTL